MSIKPIIKCIGICFLLVQASCATEPDFSTEPNETLKKIIEYEKRFPNVSREEIDDYAYLWFERQQFKPKHNMTGQVGVAIAVAYNKFLEEGLLKEENEFSNRLIVVSDTPLYEEYKELNNDRKSYYVYFLPRLVPVETLYEPGNAPQGFTYLGYPVERYAFIVDVETLEVVYFELIPR